MNEENCSSYAEVLANLKARTEAMREAYKVERYIFPEIDTSGKVVIRYREH